MLSAAARSAEWLLVEHAIANPNTPQELWAELLPSLGFFGRAALAARPNTAPDLLRKLAQDGHEGVRMSVAANECCPQDILWEFRSDTTPVLSAAVANPSCPAALLELVADKLRRWSGTDAGWLLAQELATRHLPDPLWDVVWETSAGASSGALQVRAILASNEHCSSEVLRDLAHDRNWMVRASAEYRLTQQGMQVALAEERWSDVVAPFGLPAEQVAWSLLCAGFDGSLQTLAQVAAGAVREQ